MQEATATVLGELEQTLYERAKAGDTAVLIYLGKSRLGWHDRPHDDQELRREVSAIKAAIGELPADTQKQLLASYQQHLQRGSLPVPR